MSSEWKGMCFLVGKIQLFFENSVGLRVIVCRKLQFCCKIIRKLNEFLAKHADMACKCDIATPGIAGIMGKMV